MEGKPIIRVKAVSPSRSLSALAKREAETPRNLAAESTYRYSEASNEMNTDIPDVPDQA